jgi:hypothetical protein
MCKIKMSSFNPFLLLLPPQVLDPLACPDFSGVRLSVLSLGSRTAVSFLFVIY